MTFGNMSFTKNEFSKKLLQWNNKTNNRPMPWKGEKDPYKIWLSEIILQQTRVEQGWDYYNRFVVAFPTINKLAAAKETTVFKLWEGLGYYTRCKNLILTAKYIANEKKGIFPDNYQDILNLKGIGPYTAAAIASFAYNLPYAVVDGNVFRVLSRYFNDSNPIDSTEGKNKFTQLANELLDKKQPGIYNQAIMDFGAVVCKPKLPLCHQCPLQKSCGAYTSHMVNVLPIKEKTIIQKQRWFFYFIIEKDGNVLVQKRGAKDIWENLYQFVLIETSAATDINQLQKLPEFVTIFGKSKSEIKTISKPYKQKLTHQLIHAQFISNISSTSLQLKDYKWVSKKNIESLPFPKLITSYLKDKNVSLNLL